jgi:hypothetical protein
MQGNCFWLMQLVLTISLAPDMLQYGAIRPEAKLFLAGLM